MVGVEAMRTVGWRVEVRASEREIDSEATLLRAMEELEWRAARMEQRG
jgi:hypothetical protein